jgi:hypothetical protein
MSSLGSLVVSLAMDTAKFTGDVGKAAQQMARLTAEAGKIGAAIGANIVIAGAAFKNLVVGAINAADETYKLSQSIGMTVEQVSALGYAAELAGTTQEDFGKSMSKLARSAVDAAAGGKSALEVWGALGVAVKGTDGAVRPMNDLLGDVADKFASYKDGAEKTALAQELFGKAGAALIPFLNQGRDGIAGLAAEAAQLGIVLTTEAGAAAEQFNDNLTRLQKAKEGLGRQIAQALLPMLENLTTQLFKAAQETGGFEKAAMVAATGVKILMSAGAAMVGVFKTVGEAIGGIAGAAVALFSGRFSEAFTIVTQTGLDLVTNVKGSIGSISAIWDESSSKVYSNAAKNGGKLAAPIVTAAEKVKKEKSEIQKSIEEIEKKLQGMRLDVDTQGASERIKGLIELLRKPGFTGAQVEEFIKLSKAIEDYKTGLETAAKAERERMDVAREIAALNEENLPPLEKLIERYKELDFLLSRGLSASAYRQEVEKAQKAYEEAMDTVKDVMSIGEEFAKKARENIQDAIGNGLVEIMNGNFKNIGDAFVKMLQRMVAEALAAKLMSSMFGDAKPGGTGGGGVFGNVLSSIGQFLFGGKAYGGPVSAGRAVRVGEHGPEVFMPAVAGSIVPERQLAGPPRSVVVNVQAVPGMSRQTALQQGQMIGEGLQRAIARNG